MCFGRKKPQDTHSEASGRQSAPPAKTGSGGKKKKRTPPADKSPTTTTTTTTTTDNPLRKTQACSPRQTQPADHPNGHKKVPAKSNAIKPSAKKPVIFPYTPVSPADVIEVTPMTTEQEKALTKGDESLKKAKKSNELAATTAPSVAGPPPKEKPPSKGSREEKKTQDAPTVGATVAPTKRIKTNFQRDEESENPDLSSFAEKDGMDMKPIDRVESRNLDKVVGPKDSDYDTISGGGGLSDDNKSRDEGGDIVPAHQMSNKSDRKTKVSKKNKKGGLSKTGASGKKKMQDGLQKTQRLDLSVHGPPVLGVVDNASHDNLQKTQALPVDDQPKPLMFRPSLTVDTRANREANTQQLTAPD